MDNKQPLRRCAIYTRKSSDEGLDQSFNSLDAQREACEAYIKSQKHEGWSTLKASYDDGGYSGGSMNRPALQALLSDIEAGKIDIIVVYKVDRLTRSLADFSKIVDVLDAKDISFVSITQQFNTTTSMGRLTLNVLLSFAQFEREVTGERIRDKIAASKKKGMWMGGNPPLGYDAKDRQLVVNKKEAERVRLIYQRYLDLGSVAELAKDLRNREIFSKRWTTQTGRVLGGKPMMRGALYDLLQNRVYLGEITHREASYPGNHDPIVPLDLWNAVQTLLAENRRKDLGKKEAVTTASPLTGLIVDDRGHPMSPTYTQKASGQRYRYYVSAALLDKGRGEPGAVSRLPAPDTEDLVRREISGWLCPEATDRIEWSVLIDLVTSITVRRDGLEVALSISALRENRFHPAVANSRDWSKAGKDTLHRTIRTKLIKVRGETFLHVPHGSSSEPRPDQAITKALARGWRWRRMLEVGEATSFESLGREEDVGDRYIASLVQLTFLAPEVTKRLVEGRQPAQVDLAYLLRREIPLSWQDTRLGL